MTREDTREHRVAAAVSYATEARFRALIQNATDIITIHDVSGITLYETPSASRVLGYPPGALIGKSPFDSIHPRDVSAARAAFDALVGGAEQRRTVEFRFRHADGSWIHLEAIGSNLLHDPGIEGIVLTSRDISARKQAESRIQYLAHHDVLTGLPNRYLMEDRLSQALAQARENRQVLALLFVDLDQFRLINDSFGRSAGDQLLREVARRVSSCTRAGDTVARIAADTYTVVLPSAGSIEHVSAIAQRILTEIARPGALPGHEAFVSASIGISLFPADAASEEELLNHAESALQSAKDSGRQTHRFFSEDLNARVRERALLEHGLRGALARGELMLEYQPKIALADGRVVGVEALARWQHPRLGLIVPDSFIPVAEEAGLIGPIAEWVLHSACRQLREWSDAGLDVAVAVNLSPSQFRDERLADIVHAALDAAGADARRLEIEITESELMDDAERAVRTLQALKARGVRIAIDDFGTGYSSLSYLNRFPLDVLKIDQSFIEGIEAGGGAAAIVRAILALAQSLDLAVVAEGVETQAQRAFLKRHGCDFAQGFLISAPVPARRVAELARAAQPR